MGALGIRGGLLAAVALLAGAGPAGAIVPAGNLILDPGAETGSSASGSTAVPPPNPPWFAGIGTESQVHYGATGGFPGTAVSTAIGGGSAFFAGGPATPNLDPNGHLISQTVDLSAAATEIDRGHVRADLSGYLGGFAGDADDARVTADFTDAGADNTFLTLQIGPVTPADRANQTTLLSRATSGTVPAGTRSVLITVAFTRASGAGTYNDGYADNLSLTLADHTAPVVHTTGADTVTQSGARVTGTIDDFSRHLPYHFEYGTTAAYGQSTATQSSAGTAGSNPVQATLGGLTPGNDYHARLVVDGPDGPVPGEDVTFHTAGVDPNAPGLPAGLDFSWSPRADVQIAGAPVGGLRFAATAGPGVTYAWDFDYHDGAGFVADEAASGPVPRHGFTADGAHDTDKAAGADGERRRLYTVRLRGTAANGQTADVTHQLVVVPDSPPKVDFVMDGAGGPVSAPVTFRPQVSDPDQTTRTADSIDHLEWNFDTPINGQGPVDLVCDAAGANCRLPDGTAPGPWVTAGSGGAVSVDFWRRSLAAHGLRPLGDLDLDALPASRPDGSPLKGGIGVLSWTKQPFYVAHDPRLSYLYENATLLMQSSFDKDAGEATGTKYGVRQSLARSVTKVARPVVPFNHELVSSLLGYRQVTLTAVDSAGARTSITHVLPLRPDQPPQLSARFVNASADGSTKTVTAVPGRGHGKATHGQGQPLSQILSQPLTTADELVFDASDTSDPDGRIAYYTLEVGKPLTEPGHCTPGKPLVDGPAGVISLDPPSSTILPGQFFGAASTGGTGPGLPPGAVGNLKGAGAVSAKSLQKTSFRAQPQLPNLGQLLGKPYLHPCGAYSARNVVPDVFKARGGPEVRPAARTAPVARPIDPSLLGKIGNLEYDTTAIVTRDASKLRFRIPKEGTYSVAVGAYDSEGQGAVQRTDGFRVETPTGTCSKISGATVRVADHDPHAALHNLGFSGLCVDFGSSRRYYWSTREVDIDGVELRPEAGSGIFIDTCKGDATCTPQVFATHAHEPDLRSRVDVGHLPQNGGVSVLVDGDPVADFAPLSAARMSDWISGTSGSQPIVSPGATYKGSLVARADHAGPDATTFGVTFGAPEGSSDTTFSIVLPGAFGTDPATAPPTSVIARHGFDEPRSTTLTTTKFADIASRRRHSRAVARAAALALKGSVDLSGLWLGPVEIKSGRADFDPSAGDFELNVTDASIWMPDPNPATLHLKIAGGALREAGGSAGAHIAIFPGVFLNQLRFSIITDPLTLKGGAGFTALDVLTGDIDLTVRPEPLLLRLDGSIGLSGLTLGHAFIQYDAAQHHTLTFGGHFGYDFGPVSANADLKGGIAFESPAAFYIEGSGRACLGFCLGVDALVSNIAVAACGTIDLAVTSISAGFAFTFDGPSLDVFTGCDLSGYVPAVFKTREGPSLRAGPGGAGTLSVAAGTQQAAFRFAAPSGSGGTPIVTLTAPDGHVFRTSATPGDYAFSPPGPVGVGAGPGGVTKAPSALVDQDPVDHVTTFLVADPPAGDWTVSVDPGGPAVASAEVATGAHLPDAALRAKIEPATVEHSGLRIGSQTFAIAGAGKSAASSKVVGKVRVAPQIVRALRAVPAVEDHRLRGVVLNIPAGLGGTLTVLDAGPTGVSVVRTLDLAKTSGKVPIAFDPSAEGGVHRLRAFIAHANGVPRDEIDIGTFVGPPMPAPSRPKLVVRRTGHQVFLIVSPGSAGPLSGPLTRFELIAATSAGQRIERFIDAGDAHRMSHGRFRVALGRVAGGVSVRATGRMLYGTFAGAGSTVRLRRR